MTTLDTLVAEYGEPAFCKIDVEGFEVEALKGLSRPLRALSFEYGPPRSPKPPTELYADLLLKSERFEEARVLYEETLQRTPARTLTLVPLAMAAERSDRPARARRGCRGSAGPRT